MVGRSILPTIPKKGFLMMFDFTKIDHFQKYPTMEPFVGKNYVSVFHKKVLLIGESFYLPNETTVHHSVHDWYNGDDSSIKDWELEWMDTKGLLNCSWQSNGHMIYRELNRCVKTVFSNSEFRGVDEIAFINYFQRPSEREGDSFKQFIKHEDIIISKSVINQVIETITPDTVIFVSKYSWDIGNQEIKKTFPKIQVDYVCHPGTGGLYWNNKSYRHGKNKFLEILRKNVI